MESDSQKELLKVDSLVSKFGRTRLSYVDVPEVTPRAVQQGDARLGEEKGERISGRLRAGRF